MSPDVFPLLMKALGETVAMVAVAMVAATAVGVPLGVALVVTAKGGILACPGLNRVLAAVVNAALGIEAPPMPGGDDELNSIGEQHFKAIIGCFEDYLVEYDKVTSAAAGGPEA